MLTNLFTMFDPFIYKISPFTLTLILYLWYKISYKNIWIMPNNNLIMSSNKIYFFKKEFSKEIMSFYSKKVKNSGAMKMFFNMFFFIFFINFISLFPFIMSTTSHLSLNMPMATCMWLTTIIMALKIEWKHFFSHLTPLGTPTLLMSFMVLIETISNIIRPITLSVRLMANMVAGHLLLVLLSNFNMNYLMSTMGISSIMLIILTLLEMMVTFIQAYVFTLLLILYFKEAF